MMAREAEAVRWVVAEEVLNWTVLMEHDSEIRHQAASEPGTYFASLNLAASSY